MLLNASGLFNTITDLIIVLLPVKAVWNMKMEKKRKITVVLVFTFGLWYVFRLRCDCASTYSCESAPAFSLVGFVVRLRGSNNPDKTWVQPDIVMWG